MSDQNKRPLTRGEQLSILHHSMVTWRELKLNAYLKLIRQKIEEGRERNADSPEQSLAYEKELHDRLTGDLLKEFFDNSAKIEELRKIIAEQELPDGCSFVAFFRLFDEMLSSSLSSVLESDSDNDI